MKYFLYIIVFSPIMLSAQSDSYYHSFNVLNEMLEGKEPLDFTKAVYLVENAYFEDSLSLEDYRGKVKQIAKSCKAMIAEKGIQHYKTAGNWAIFMWMTQKVTQNNKQPCNYDFEDFLGDKKYSDTFVWRLMTEKKGNCISLPLLYKMIAQEMKVEAKLSIGPNHAWIRHIDENGKWANVELTSGQFPTDGVMMTELGITTEAIKSGAYCAPLTEKESIAFLLNLLAQGYEAKFGRLDDFTEKCNDLSIRYYAPNTIAYMMKSNKAMKDVKNTIASNSGTWTKESEHFQQLYLAYQTKLTELGVSEMKPEEYSLWVDSMKKRKS